MSGTVSGTKANATSSAEETTLRLDDLLRRVDELIATGKNALANPVKTYSTGMTEVRDDAYSEFKVASLSFLDRTFGATAAFSVQFRREVASGYSHSLNHGLGILQAARGELAGGWIETTRGLITAEVFADFLEMGEHLLDEHYKDAAAVMIGGTLEEHLRQLATAKGIPVEELKQSRMVPRKADAINADLAKSVYGKLDQKNVTAGLISETRQPMPNTRSTRRNRSAICLPVSVNSLPAFGRSAPKWRPCAPARTSSGVGSIPTEPTEIALYVREGLERIARGAQ
jgi:hypothetical protein